MLITRRCCRACPSPRCKSALRPRGPRRESALDPPRAAAKHDPAQRVGGRRVGNQRQDCSFRRGAQEHRRPRTRPKPSPRRPGQAWGGGGGRGRLRVLPPSSSPAPPPAQRLLPRGAPGSLSAAPEAAAAQLLTLTPNRSSDLDVGSHVPMRQVFTW